MKEVCIYQLDSGRNIPSWVVDGGYFSISTDDTMIGICDGAPAGVERISVWELQKRLLDDHALVTYTDEDDVALTNQQVEDMGWDFFVDKIGTPTMADIEPYQKKLLAAADERIIRWDEQTDLAVTKTDAGVSYTAENTTTYTDRDALLWYKQDIRDIDVNYTDPQNISWPTPPT
jgi:hypothetical protein